MIRFNLSKNTYEWDRWKCGYWTPLSSWLAERLMDEGEEFGGTVR